MAKKYSLNPVIKFKLSKKGRKYLGKKGQMTEAEKVYKEGRY